MPVLTRSFWCFKLKRGRKIHLAEPSQSGDGPLDITLCGKRHDPADRLGGAAKKKVIEPSACPACLRKAGYIDPRVQLSEDSARITKIAQDLHLSPEAAMDFWNKAMEARNETIRRSQLTGSD
jgi:hypothetical protein